MKRLGTISAALLVVVSTTAGQVSGVRYWCFDYVREYITGEISTPGHSVSDLRSNLGQKGYRAQAFSNLYAPGISGVRGDVLILGDIHAAIFVAPGLLNQYFGETYADALERTWTVEELRAFTRTKDPAYGNPIPAHQPFSKTSVELWKAPASGTPEPPQAVAGRRCASVNPASRLQCRYLPGHAGEHRDWSAATWTDASTGKPSAAPAVEIGLAGGAMTADEAGARINELLQNVRRYRHARRYDDAIDALEEATRLAGGRPERGQPGGPDSERVLRAVADLRTSLIREGDAIIQQVTELDRGLDGQREFVRRVRFATDRFRPNGFEAADPTVVISGLVKDSRSALAIERPLAPTAGPNPQRLVVSMRAAADAVCQSDNPVQAKQTCDQISQDRQRVEDAANVAAEWWQRRQGPVELPLSIGSVKVIRLAIDQLEQDLGNDDTAFRNKLTEFRTSLSSALIQFRAAHKKADTEIDSVQALARPYKRAGQLGPFAEDRATEWNQSANKLWGDLDRDVREVEDLCRDVDDLAAGSTFWGAAAMRRNVAAVVRRIESLERDLDARDKQASAVLTADGEAQKAMRRANDCLRALQSRPAAPAQQAPLTPGQRTLPVQPAPTVKPSITSGGQPQTSKPPAQVTRVRPAGSPAQQAPANVPATPPAVDRNTAGGIRIQSATTRIMVGQRVQFVATDFGNRPYTANVAWTSLREDLLSVDDQGWAIGIQPGKLSIVARYGDDMPANIDVEVVEAPQGGFRVIGSTTVPAGGAGTTQAPPPAAQGATGASAGVTPSGTGGFRVLGGSTRQAEAETPTRADAAGTAQAGAAGAPTQDGTGRAQGAGGQPASGGSAGTGTSGGGSGSGSRISDQVTRIAAGQPAAYHIFATGSRLGWASGLAQYTIGSSDRDIAEHLRAAGDHTRMANQESYPPTPAWPDWATRQAAFNSWGRDLLGSPGLSTRGQIPARANSTMEGMAAAIRVQTVGETQQMPNCDAIYMRLGFHMAYGQQSLLLAQSVLNRDGAAATRQRQDGINHLQTANQILIDYEQVKQRIASGVCADLADVRTRLQQLFGMNVADIAGQANAATADWDLALQRISAISGGSSSLAGLTGGSSANQPRTGPPEGETDLVGEWQYILSNRLAGSSYRAEIAAGEHVPAFEAAISRLLGQSDSRRKTVIFSRSGNDYVGVFKAGSSLSLDGLWTEDSSGMVRGLYRQNQEVFRLIRTGRGAYQGTFLYLSETNSAGRWLPTTVRVENGRMYQTGSGDQRLYGSPNYPPSRITHVWASKSLGPNPDN